MPDAPSQADVLKMLNAARGGFEVAIGLVFTRATPTEIACEVPVGPHLTQSYGIVHGGVYASIVETLAGFGAALVAMPRGQTAVGLENSTTLLRAVRGGTLTGVGVPLHIGTRTQVWEADVRDADGRLVAKGRVRMQCLEAGAQVGGETVGLKSSGS